MLETLLIHIKEGGKTDKGLIFVSLKKKNLLLLDTTNSNLRPKEAKQNSLKALESEQKQGI